LENLVLFINPFDSENFQTIDDNIIKLTENCAKLKELEIFIGNDSLITDRIFYAFGSFFGW